MTALVQLYGTTHAQLVAWVLRTYGVVGTAESQFMNQHRLRREAMSARLRFYRDQAIKDIEGLINAVYETQEYQRTLTRYVPIALEQNVTRRIIDEIASLYDKPALRTFSSAKLNAEFHAEEKRIRLHEVMQEAHRLTTLCNEVLLWQYISVDAKPRLCIITPDMFDAVPDPRDKLVPAGFIIDMCPVSMAMGTDRAKLPHFELWDDTYRYQIDTTGRMVDDAGNMVDAPIEHGLERIPAVLFHRREPTTVILDGSHGADIDSCHRGVALLNVMIMRLAKAQGENQPILQGNLAAMATGQVMNGERPLALPPEVVASVLNTKTDPEHYIKTKREKIASTASTYGLSYEQFTNTESGDSGKAYEMRREKLKEIRGEARRRAVVHENETAELMGFDASNERLDFQEQSLPQDAIEELQLMRDKAGMGLDSPVKYLMRKDPDLSVEEAKAQIAQNQDEFAEVIMKQRALNLPADSTLDQSGASPQVNGAKGGATNGAPAIPSTATGAGAMSGSGVKSTMPSTM